MSPLCRRLLLFVLVLLLAGCTRAQEGAETVNRLANEKSPYLRQHAHNPVDWYPWGEEAFEKARREGKPIFLSVGYSTCHWCHVMERESFENPAIAALLNKHFVAIKVDREERPDVDRVYMAYVVATTGSGGWPMSVFLTPQRKPFFGGTYFPPEARYGRPGFGEVLERISQLWQNDRERVLTAADEVVAALSTQATPPKAGDLPTEAALKGALAAFSDQFDSDWGGFGGAPKFPRPVTLELLLRTRDPSARDMVVKTLQAMARGGLQDHLGGGFHRYSTDPRWHIPHFEKMLYDQAQLVAVYLDAYRLTGDEELATAARRALDYVARDLNHPAGGFYSAEDADSAPDSNRPKEKLEGAFYVWTAAEVDSLLGEDSALFKFRYGVEPDGNAQEDSSGELTGKNHLYEAHTLSETAREHKLSPEEAEERLEADRQRLFKARELRLRPHLDDKIITAWNGLMISAFARSYEVLGRPGDLEQARRAADFVLAELRTPEGRLLRHFREGAADVEGFNSDYGSFIAGLLDLYQASFDPRYLEMAAELQEIQLELFWDEQEGAFFETTGQDPSVLVRAMETDDSAQPSSNSTSAHNLLRLSQILDREDYQDKAGRVLARYGTVLSRAPTAMPHMASALDRYLTPKSQVVLAGALDSQDARRLLEAVRSRYLPNTILLPATGRVASMKPLEGRATAYVCENFACQAPTTDSSVLLEQLDKLGSRP